MTEYDPVKVVVVGDKGVGKTSWIISWQTGCHPYDNIPERIDKYTATLEHAGTTYTMCIWDTAGGWEHDVMRPLAYQGAHYILLLYSTVDIYSFANVKAKWLPELAYHAPGVPVLLVGTKTDLRVNTPSHEHVVSYEQGEALASETGLGWCEGSALTHDNRNYSFAVVLAQLYPQEGGTSEAYDDSGDHCCTIL